MLYWTSMMVGPISGLRETATVSEIAIQKHMYQNASSGKLKGQAISEKLHPHMGLVQLTAREKVGQPED